MKIALCNEVLQPLPFEQQCRLAAALGYDGLEVAPFTLAEDPLRIDDAQARTFARIAHDHGLAITGLHWLLVAPAGLSIVASDASLRDRTAGVMERLVELCAAMGGRYLVHGSPRQRSVPAGATHAQAWDRAQGLPGTRSAPRRGMPASPTASSRSRPARPTCSTPSRTGCAWCEEIGSPALRTMIDCSAAGQAEQEPVHALMERWMPTGHIGHVQVNDPNRRGPGQGALRFEPILRTLLAMQRQGHYGDIDRGRTVRLRARRPRLRGPRHRLPSRHSGRLAGPWLTAPRFQVRAIELFERPVHAAAAVPLRRGDAARSAAGLRARAHRDRRWPQRMGRGGRTDGAQVVRQEPAAEQRGQLRPAAHRAADWRAMPISSRCLAGHGLRPFRAPPRRACRRPRPRAASTRCWPAMARRWSTGRCSMRCAALRGVSFYAAMRGNLAGIDAATRSSTASTSPASSRGCVRRPPSRRATRSACSMRSPRPT